MGPNHPTVLATFGTLADACVCANHGTVALKYYEEILERLNERDEDDSRLQEAVILHKMSKIHKQHGDLQSELTKLQRASRVLRLDSRTSMSKQAEDLDHVIQVDLREARQTLEAKELQWV